MERTRVPFSKEEEKKIMRDNKQIKYRYNKQLNAINVSSRKKKK